MFSCHSVWQVVKACDLYENFQNDCGRLQTHVQKLVFLNCAVYFAQNKIEALFAVKDKDENGKVTAPQMRVCASSARCLSFAARARTSRLTRLKGMCVCAW